LQFPLSDKQLQFQGHWTPSKSELSINKLEAMTGSFVLQHWLAFLPPFLNFFPR
jgi:hypothetical protein